MRDSLARSWEVLWVVALSDLRLKYQNSKLGFIWSLIRPTLRFFVYYTIFTIFIPVAHGRFYPLRLFFGVILWELFSEGTNLGMNSFIGKKALITKVRLNTALLPISGFLAPLLNFCLSFAVFLGLYFIAFSDRGLILSVQRLLVFIYGLGMIGLVVIELNLLLANLNALFRDIEHIWFLVLTYGVFLTPIIYNIPVPQKWQLAYYCVNLLAFPLSALTSVFFDQQQFLFMHWGIALAHAIVVAAVFLVAWRVHRHLNRLVIDLL